MMRTTALIPTMHSMSNGRKEWDVLKSSLDTLETTLFSDPFFDDFFALRTGKAARFPKIDMWETTNTYEVEANVAGLNKDEVSVSLDENNTYLVLSGERKQGKEGENGRYLVSELSYKKFHRQIPLPGPINSEGIDARYDNGILRITIPRVVEAKSEGKRIEIK